MTLSSPPRFYIEYGNRNFRSPADLKKRTGKTLRLYSKAAKTVLFIRTVFAAALIAEEICFLVLWMGEDFARETYAAGHSYDYIQHRVDTGFRSWRDDRRTGKSGTCIFSSYI